MSSSFFTILERGRIKLVTIMWAARARIKFSFLLICSFFVSLVQTFPIQLHRERQQRQRSDTGAMPLQRREFLNVGATASFWGLFPILPSPAVEESSAFVKKHKFSSFDPRPPALEGYDPENAAIYPQAGQSYFPALTPPFKSRATYRYELGRNTWALEQLLTFANVTATIRTIVVQMQDGGLWVNGPLYPTNEYCHLLNELGTVQHLVVPCNAIEHKAPLQAFITKYPNVQSVWISPGQYGPLGECGLTLNDKNKPCRMGCHIDGILPTMTAIKEQHRKDMQILDLPPWANEFDFQTLYVELPQNAGPVSEVAFLHKPTKTLITTDSVVYIPDKAPPIFDTYFVKGETKKDPAFWPKTVLQSVFLPLRRVVYESEDSDSSDEGEEGGYSSNSSGDSSGSSVDHEGSNWPGYDAIRNTLIRAPILRSFVDARAPDAVREWVESISSGMDFDRIVTAHFASPIRATPRYFRNAFGYLFEDGAVDALPEISCQDWELLGSINDFIDSNGLGAPVVFDFRKGCVAE